MNYLRKYIKNFSFVNRVVWLTVKYNFVLILLSNKRLLVLLKVKRFLGSSSWINRSNIVSDFTGK